MAAKEQGYATRLQKARMELQNGDVIVRHQVEQNLSSSSTASNQLSRSERIEGALNNIVDIIRNLNEPHSPPSSPITHTPSMKRKRLDSNCNSATPKVNANENVADDDGGLTCPICLDNWEMTGEHRLVSLKCGHLFGESCIRRWLLESEGRSANGVCPQCNTNAIPKDFRYLFVKRLRAIDRSEEHRMRNQLNDERVKCQKLELELATMKMLYTERIKSLGGDVATNPEQIKLYKLLMKHNVELPRTAGRRVMKYSEHNSALIISQNSTQGLYGIGFIDAISFKPSIFIRTARKILRDLSLSSDEQLLVYASDTTAAKIFDLRTSKASFSFTPCKSKLWSCAMDHNSSREHKVLLGSENGTTYVYDIKNNKSIVETYYTDDTDPVIGIASVLADSDFPNGGFLICKFRSLWFYEYTSQKAHPTRLFWRGWFTSMKYDVVQRTILVQSEDYPRTRTILGKLNKIYGIPVVDVKVKFKHNSVDIISTQIAVESKTLVAEYSQETNQLSLSDANRKRQVQSLLVEDVVYATCPLYVNETTYLAALTETNCQLYKLLEI